MRGIASSSFGGHACAVQLKSSNCNALPVPLAKTGLDFSENGCLKWSLKRAPKKSSKMDPKWTPNGSQHDPKWAPDLGSESDPKLGPPQGGQKVRICCYLLHFSKVRALRKGSFLRPFLGLFLDPFWLERAPDKYVEKRPKNDSILSSILDPLLGSFWEPRGSELAFRYRSSVVNNDVWWSWAFQNTVNSDVSWARQGQNQ